MTDRPIPDELVDRLARTALHAPLRHMSTEDTETLFLDVYRDVTCRVLAALTEWADGGLIDPSTWTVVEAERLGQVSVRRDGESWGYVPDEPMEPFSLSTPELSDEAWQIIEEAKRRPPARHFRRVDTWRVPEDAER